MEKQGQPGDYKSSLFSAGDLSFCQSPSGSEVLRARVEEVITGFNTAMEESQLRPQRLRQANLVHYFLKLQFQLLSNVLRSVSR